MQAKTILDNLIKVVVIERSAKQEQQTFLNKPILPKSQSLQSLSKTRVQPNLLLQA